MIQSFKHKGLEALFYRGTTGGLNPNWTKRLRARLEALDVAQSIEHLRLPGWRLHELTGDREGVWSLHVTGNWRVTFRFEADNAWDVNLEDYH